MSVCYGKAKKRLARLKPAELEPLRRAVPDRVVTDDHADRRARGLSPHPRSQGPHLLSDIPGMGAPDVHQLHAGLGQGLHERIVREADKTGDYRNVPAQSWPRAPHPSNPFARRGR